MRSTSSSTPSRAIRSVSPLFTLAIATGLRQGELLGLTWADVDWAAGTLRVERQLLRSSRFGPPKSAAGMRTIGLSDLATYALRAQRNQQVADRLRAGGRWANERDLVFTTSIGSPSACEADLVRLPRRRRTGAGVRHIRFHDLRHACATLAAHGGRGAGRHLEGPRPQRLRHDAEGLRPPRSEASEGGSRPYRRGARANPPATSRTSPPSRNCVQKCVQALRTARSLGGPFHARNRGEASARRSVSRVLSHDALRRRGDGHPSGAVGRPTAHAADPRAGQRTSSPTDVSADGCALLFGLAPGGVCPFHSERRLAPPLGIVTVALVLASRRAGVTRHPALRSSDFPHAADGSPHRRRATIRPPR